jgi:hypothetical protein
MEGTSTEEGLLMREIEDLPVVNGLSFIHKIGTVTTPTTWGVLLPPRMEDVRMEDVLFNRWDPSVCPPNIPQYETVCVSFWHESNRITAATVSLQYNHDCSDVLLIRRRPFESARGTEEGGRKWGIAVVRRVWQQEGVYDLVVHVPRYRMVRFWGYPSQVEGAGGDTVKNLSWWHIVILQRAKVLKSVQVFLAKR